MTRQKIVEQVLSAYQRRDRSLFAPSSNGTAPGARAGNSWSAAFWAGYDGLTRGPRIPTRNMISYAWYAAGRKARRAG